MKASHLRIPFSYDVDAVSTATGLECLDESLADQGGKDEADINTLVKRFGITGTVPVLDRVPLDSDFVGNVDYHSALNALIEADNAFMELPADLRTRFNHNAGDFVKFCSDEANRDELIKLGLVPKPPDPSAPLLVEIAEKPAAGS